MERLIRWLALVVSLGAIATLWFMPMYTFQVVSQSVGCEATSSVGTDTLIGANGYAVLGILAIPVLAAVSALLPWPARYRRGADIIGAIVVAVFCVLGAFTVGLFFVPTALVLLLLAVWPRARRHAA